MRAVSKILSIQKRLKHESEDIMRLKGMCPDSKVPRGVLEGLGQEGPDRFREVLERDQINDKIPE